MQKVKYFAIKLLTPSDPAVSRACCSARSAACIASRSRFRLMFASRSSSYSDFSGADELADMVPEMAPLQLLSLVWRQDECEQVEERRESLE